MSDFNDLLETSADDVKAPVPLPAGEYKFRVDNYELDRSSQKQTPYVRYLLKPLEAGEDVDEDLLAECGEWKNKTLRATFYLTENSMFMLKEFLENACEIETAGRTLKEIIPEAKGCEVIGTVTQQEGNNNRPFNPDVSNIQPAE